MSYLKEHGTRATPQMERARADQVENSAGGFVFAVDDFTRLRRFLILGSEGGSYYANERKLTKSNVDALGRCVSTDGVRTVAEILDISTNGRAPKNDQAIFALAYCVAEGNDVTKRAALEALPQVCRIGTHLFMFCDFLDSSFGKLTGRAKRRALAQWYATPRSTNVAETRDADEIAAGHADWLAGQVTKYRQRGGWTHRDVLRLAHPAKRTSPAGNPTVSMSGNTEAVIAWAAGKPNGAELPRAIEGFELAQKATDAKEIVRLITDYQLPREAIPTEYLKDASVWEALLYEGGKYGMPVTAMIRNLGNMTRSGLLAPMSNAAAKVHETITSPSAIKHARVHPMTLLFALKTYESGGGYRSSNTWDPIREVIDALDEAFYLAFDNVVPTGKRHLLALDVSGSMGSAMGDTSLTCRDASAAMALVTAKTEQKYEIVGFTGGGWGYGSRSSDRSPDDLTPLAISPRQRLTDAVKTVSNLNFGGTDCALPMIYAQEKEREIDTFIVYTDSETWAGSIQPFQALREYRKSSGISDARLIVVGMVGNEFTLADPSDPGMLDVVGFDTSSPAIMAEFTRGTI